MYIDNSSNEASYNDDDSSRISSEYSDTDDSSSGSSIFSSTSIDDVDSVSKLSLPISKRIINSDKLLSDKWVVWVNKSNDKQEFCEKFEKVFEFDTMNKFHNEWADLILKSKQLVKDTKICVFRNGVMPLWEDEKNKEGGKFSIGLSNSSIERTLEYWFTLITGMTCERFSGCSKILGSVITIRSWGTVMSMWNSNSKDMKQIYKIKKKIKKIFELSKVKYHPHKYRISSDKLDPESSIKKSLHRFSDPQTDIYGRSSIEVEKNHRSSDSENLLQPNNYRTSIRNMIKSKKNQPLFSRISNEKDFKTAPPVRNTRSYGEQGPLSPKRSDQGPLSPSRSGSYSDLSPVSPKRTGSYGEQPPVSPKRTGSNGEQAPVSSKNAPVPTKIIPQFIYGLPFPVDFPQNL